LSCQVDKEHLDAPRALLWAIPAVGFVSVSPSLIIYYGVRRRRYTDRHGSVRDQRPLPILLTLLSIAAGLVALVILHASRELLAVLVAMLVGLTISLLITLRWKISLHTGTLAGAIAILALAFSPVVVILFPLVALVGWARVKDGSHSPWQVGVGAGLGVIVATVIFVLLRWKGASPAQILRSAQDDSLPSTLSGALPGQAV
jgi:hypothetical protein